MTQPNTFAIKTHKLTRYFGKKKIVDSINLNIPKGSVYALLGRNGAGKTTTIKMLMGFLKPTRGASTLLGHNSLELGPDQRNKIGYLSEGHYLCPWMSIKEIANFQRKSFHSWNHDIFKKILMHFHLNEDYKCNKLSRGQQAGVALALTLAPDPELLILDDPALGLDPVARRNLLESIISLCQNSGKTILFSSHQLDDIERVADWVGIIQGGTLKVQCPINLLHESVIQVVLSFDNIPAKVPDLYGLLSTTINDNKISLVLVNPSEKIWKQIETMDAQKKEILQLSFEEIVFHYLNHKQKKILY